MDGCKEPESTGRRDRTPEEQAAIDQAKAILMDQGMSENDAFGTIRKRSMNTRAPMDQVAREIIAKGGM